MKIVPLAKVKTHFSAYVDALPEEAVIVTRNGEPAALLLPLSKEDDLESILLLNSKTFRRVIEESRAQYRSGQTLSHEEFWEEAEKDQD
jgi:prevent-host-death family protein